MRIVNFFINLIILFIGLAIFLSSKLSLDNLSGLIATIFLGSFFILLSACSFISANYFDKKLKLLDKMANTGTIVNITILPDSWLMSLGIFKGMLYCGTLLLYKLKLKPLMPFQQDLIKSDLFIKSSRRIDYISSYLLFLCILGLVLSLIGVGIST